MLLLAPMLMSMVPVTSRGLVNVCGLCYHQKSCESPWPVLPPACYGQGSFITENERHWMLLWQPPPPLKIEAVQTESPWKLWRGVCISLCTTTNVVDGFQVCLGGTYLFLRIWPLAVWQCFNQYMINTNWIWWISFSFCRGRHKGGREDQGRMGSRCDQGALYEIPK